MAKLEAAVYIDMNLKCFFSKPWPCVEAQANLPMGKCSVGKMPELGPGWANIVAFKHPGIVCATASQLLAEGNVNRAQKAEDNREMHLEPHASSLKRTPETVQIWTLAISPKWKMRSGCSRGCPGAFLNLMHRTTGRTAWRNQTGAMKVGRTLSRGKCSSKWYRACHLVRAKPSPIVPTPGTARSYQRTFDTKPAQRMEWMALEADTPSASSRPSGKAPCMGHSRL